MSDINIKCVCVGDGAVGKTMLMMCYAFGKIADDSYIPTVFDNYSANTKYNNETVLISMWDTAGQEDYDRIRPLSYPDTDVFLVTYSTVNPDSFFNVQTKWIKEIKYHNPHTPFVLVGTKKDLRNDPEILQFLSDREMKPITTEQGQELAKELEAFSFVECSALTQDGVKQVFEQVIKAYLHEEVVKEKIQHGGSLKKKNCNIL